MTAQNSLKMETMFVRWAILSTEKHKLHNEPEMLKQFPCRRANSLCSYMHTFASTSSSSSSICCSRSLFKFWISHWKMSKCGRLRALSGNRNHRKLKQLQQRWSTLSHFAVLRRLHQLVHSPYFHTICMSAIRPSSSSSSLSERRLD